MILFVELERERERERERESGMILEDRNRNESGKLCSHRDLRMRERWENRHLQS